MMKLYNIFLFFGLLVALSACSSSNKVSEDASVEEPEQEAVQQQSSEVADTDSEEDKRKAELEELYKEELKKTYQAKANGVTTYYILAQQQFHQAQYQNALYLINKALAIKETADVYALKGNIFLGLGSKEKFTENWKKALEMDANIPIPILPFITSELQNQGLVDADFKRNF
ncbi:MAG: hypothetical protein CL670_08860 [Balneola sp.]|jgi:tetratricopeptide (TPR) repeat protein|nr:hypothetical protein [Balneola sp.]MBE79249.1 hypothetical protein [Balneola sp.]|tara:strand:+ start:329 stop:847 length:519 start_codon:yes stop_codon:yes gene_type:complete